MLLLLGSLLSCCLHLCEWSRVASRSSQGQVVLPDSLSVAACVTAGDGAFQMGPQELSTMMRCGVAPLIFVLNNGVYGIEEMIHAGDYNRLKVTLVVFHASLCSDDRAQGVYCMLSLDTSVSSLTPQTTAYTM